MYSGRRPTSRSVSATRSVSSPPEARSLTRSGSPTICGDRHPRVQRRVRVLEDGPDLAPERAQLAAAQSRPGRPPHRRRGGSGSGRRSAGTRAAMHRPRVVFPQPDSPTRPRVSPRCDDQVDAVDGPHHAGTAAEQPAPGPELASTAVRPRAAAHRSCRHLPQQVGRTVVQQAPGAHGRRPGSAADRWTSQTPGITWSQRVWNGQPAGRLCGCGTTPRIVASRLSRLRAARPSAPTAAAPACTGAAASWNSVVDVALLDDLAEVHHRHPVGDLGHHAEVVGDEHDRHAELLLQLPQQLQDLRLGGDVQRRRRLVGDQQLRPAGQRHRDHRALPHAAGQLERVRVDPLLGPRDADPAQFLDRALPRLGLARPARASGCSR